jgi:hypothetical protein
LLKKELEKENSEKEYTIFKYILKILYIFSETKYFRISELIMQQVLHNNILGIFIDKLVDLNNQNNQKNNDLIFELNLLIILSNLTNISYKYTKVNK